MDTGKPFQALYLYEKDATWEDFEVTGDLVFNGTTPNAQGVETPQANIELL